MLATDDEKQKYRGVYKKKFIDRVSMEVLIIIVSRN